MTNKIEHISDEQADELKHIAADLYGLLRLKYARDPASIAAVIAIMVGAQLSTLIPEGRKGYMEILDKGANAFANDIETNMAKKEKVSMAEAPFSTEELPWWLEEKAVKI